MDDAGTEGAVRSTADDQARRHADDGAIDWLIQLREAPDDPDVRARFDEWHAASPHNARAWADTVLAYDRAGDVSRGITPHWRRPFIGRRTLAAAAVAACVLFAAAPGLRLRWMADHVTGRAELRRISLSDGSSIALAPDSAVTVDIGGDHRRVHLLKGEAWFEVQHDATRPFEVDARGVSTTVLGTAFDVRLDAAGVTTAVERGRVLVEYRAVSSALREELAPGDTIRVALDGTPERHTPTTAVGAWRDRRIVVEDRPAAEVIDALRPWFSGVIVTWDPVLASRRVTGVYDAANPVEALRGLLQATGGRVTSLTPWVIVLSDR